MTAAHTPGPWKVTHDDYAGHYDVSTFDPQMGSEAIAQVFYVANAPGGRGEADARLIAAAPELLEALEKMLSLLNAVCALSDDNYARDDWQDVLNANAAIAKARGAA